MEEKKTSTKTLVTYGLLTAIVVILQLLGSFVRFGPFSISLVLMPIVIGGALCGPAAGAWLGFVFSVTVLCTDSSAFLAVSIPGTLCTVILKGVLAGYLSGLVYKALEKTGSVLATFAAAFVCPVVNTGIFLLGCRVFFMPQITEWGQALGFENAAKYLIFGMVGGNFIFEFVINMILSPVIVRLVKMRSKK